MVKAMHAVKFQGPIVSIDNQSIYFLFVSHQSALPFLRYSYLKIDL